MNDPRWDGLTYLGKLPIGVMYAGKRHKHYVLRIPMAGDLVAAQEDHPEALVRLISLDLYRRQLLQLGDIPPEAITLELLRQELTEPDLAELERADGELQKKFERPSRDSATGDALNTPLSSTATDSTKSDA